MSGTRQNPSSSSIGPLTLMWRLGKRIYLTSEERHVRVSDRSPVGAGASSNAKQARCVIGIFAKPLHLGNMVGKLKQNANIVFA